MLESAKCRDLDRYNAATGAALPRIVVVIDEAANLMAVAKKAVEAAVSRLAAEARAAGVHIIMATQRPTVDVVTGTIKENFPWRLAYKMTQREGSRTVIGECGAENC
jgi:S-DNA-T family DNA segregation ATPase FtsK/SpoIIIE